MDERTPGNFNPNTCIYREDYEYSDGVYNIEKGWVELHSSRGRVPKSISVLGQGGIFGFLASLRLYPGIETARDPTSVRCVSIAREWFLSILLKNSDIPAKLINFFSDELRVYYDIMFSFGRHIILAKMKNSFVWESLQ